MAHRIDPTTDVLAHLEELAEMLNRVKSFGPIAFGYHADELQMKVRQVRACMPKELKDAASLTRERQRMLQEAKTEADGLMEFAKREAQRLVDEAQSDAERISQQAKLQQEQLLSESEILRLAKSQSEEIRNSADRESAQMRRGAEQYAHDVLTNLESVVGRVLATIERGRAEIDVNDHPPARERIRLN